MSRTKIGEVNEMNFKKEVLDSVCPVLVAFEASWSGACSGLDALLGEVADGCSEYARVVRVDADVNLGLGVWYEVEYLPTLLCFVNGQVSGRMVGPTDSREVLTQLKKWSAGDASGGEGPN